MLNIFTLRGIWQKNHFWCTEITLKKREMQNNLANVYDDNTQVKYFIHIYKNKRDVNGTE